MRVGSRETVTIVCLRTADAAPRVVTPGSTTGRCSACGEEVWIAPSSMAAAMAALATATVQSHE